MNIGYVLFALAALAFAFAGFVAVAVIAWKLLGGRGNAAVRSTPIRPTAPTPTPALGVTLEDLVEDFDRRNANEAFAVETRAKLAARIAKMLGDELPDPKA